MKYTNEHNIPEEIIRAVHNDSYSRGASTISVTGVLRPPQMRLLEEKHIDDISVDVSDEIWKLLGQSVHTILERANEDNPDTITEERMYANVGGWTVSGQTDSISVDSGILKDYKVTSVWSVISAMKEGKIDWEQQLNCYDWLKPGGKMILHLVNRDKFDPILNAGDPLIVVSALNSLVTKNLKFGICCVCTKVWTL